MPVFQLSNTDYRFPPAECAEDDGLIAVGGDLSPERLLNAYCSGIFPWYNQNTPTMWWSPDPRTLLLPQEFHLPKRLQRTIKQQQFRVQENTNFRSVITNCAQVPRKKQKGTWITAEMIEAYDRLHQFGLAHSIEVYCQEYLVGGLYGVQLGKAFFAESMFSTQRDASKIALAHLAETRFEQGFHFIDAQVYNNHLGQFGFQEYPRHFFLNILRKAVS